MNSNPMYSKPNYFTACGIYVSLSGNITVIYTFTMMNKFFLVSSIAKQAFLIR